MKAPLSRRPQPYVEPINADECGQKGGTLLLFCPQRTSRANRANSQRHVQALTGLTPGQLIDLHYVNYGCDVEQRVRNGSRCCATHV